MAGRGTLTLGDNHKVHFSQAMIFMASNLGVAEMSAVTTRRLGFSAMQPKAEQPNENRAELDSKIEKSGVEAARRSFTPEFMNRLDKVVVFRPLGVSELEKTIDTELNMVHQRIFNSSPDRPFVFDVTESAKRHLLREGIDIKYGARHLKRAVERLLVQPMSNLKASDQVHAGDWVRVDFNSDSSALLFLKEADGLPMQAVMRVVNASLGLSQGGFSSATSCMLPSLQTLTAMEPRYA